MSKQLAQRFRDLIQKENPHLTHLKSVIESIKGFNEGVVTSHDLQIIFESLVPYLLGLENIRKHPLSLAVWESIGADPSKGAQFAVVSISMNLIEQKRRYLALTKQQDKFVDELQILSEIERIMGDYLEKTYSSPNIPAEEA